MKASGPDIVSIRGTKVSVPQGAAPADVKRAVHLLEQRLEAIQQASTKLNTYTFAAQLNLELMLELLQLEAAHKSDIHDLLRQLTKLNDLVESTLDAPEAGGKS